MCFVEWSPEGKLNGLHLMIQVGATEKILRKQYLHMLVCEGVGVFTSMPGGTAGDSTLVPAIWG